MLAGVDADDVIAALEAPADDRQPVMARLEAEAPARALAGALARGPERLTRQLAADLLGRRADPAGGAALLAALGDTEPRVRSAAADALGKVLLAHGPAAVPDAGSAILRAYHVEASPGARAMLAAAMGAADLREAIPLLRAAATDPEQRGLAHAARWSLGRLGAGLD